MLFRSRAAVEAAVAAGADPGLAERYHVLDYLVAMEQAYACADGVICRSGAGTVADVGCEASFSFSRMAVMTGSFVNSSAQLSSK